MTAQDLRGSARSPHRRLLSMGSSVVGQKVLINLAILLVIWIVLALLQPRFLSVENLTNVLRQISTLVVVGSVVTLLMVSRNFDLSVGGVVALSGSVAAVLTSLGWSIELAFVAGTLTGVLIGAANGLMVVFIGINSVIATLGMMFLTRGAALLVTGGVPVYTVPRGYSWVGAGYVGAIPIPVIIMLVFVVVMTVVERRTWLGKYARATGSNPLSAKLSGVPTRRVQLILFALSGTAAAWGGIMVSSRVGGGIPGTGEGLEFAVVVAAVLGGTSLAGGEGLVIGTLLGALLLGTVNNGLNLLGVPSFWQQVALGLVLVFAVLLDAALRARARRGRERRPRDKAPGSPAAARSGASS